MSNTNKDNRAINLQAAIDAIMDLRIVSMGGARSGYGLVNSALEAYRAGVISALRRLPEVHVWGGNTNKAEPISMRYIGPSDISTLRRGAVYRVRVWSEGDYINVQADDYILPFLSPEEMAKHWRKVGGPYDNLRQEASTDAPSVRKVKLHRLFE